MLDALEHVVDGITSEVMKKVKLLQSYTIKCIVKDMIQGLMCCKSGVH